MREPVQVDAPFAGFHHAPGLHSPASPLAGWPALRSIEGGPSLLV
ncbi:hypothetical protein P3T21_006989 [Paraburkholderia sp. GAS334]